MSVEGNTVTTNETDPTASTAEPEPTTQAEPDLVIYEMPQVDPASVPEVEAKDDAVVNIESEGDDDVDARAESYDRADFQAPTDEVETHDEPGVATEAQDDLPSEDEPEIDDDAELVGLPKLNGDGPAGIEAEAIEGRPFLNDRSVFEERWNAVLISFVDNPRQAVESADHLVSEAIDDLANHRESLQAQWRQGDNVDTEQLRVIVQRYQAFLLGLLNT
jgi:hypothetical protein